MKTLVSTKLTALSDEELMMLFKNSCNNQYFELLVSRYKSKLYSVAFNLLGDAYEAEEIVQETFIRVWRNCQNFKTDSSFAGWIFTIIQNLCKDVWRGRRRKNNYEIVFSNPLFVQEQDDSILGYKKTIDQLCTAESEPGIKAEFAELRTFLSACIEQLPKNQKQAIILRDIEGHSYKKIALLTGVSIGTVRSRLFYGRQKLKQKIK